MSPLGALNQTRIEQLNRMEQALAIPILPGC